jgi:hypothetical protein
MPFELGMAIGAKRFGGRSRAGNNIKIMVAEPYKLPAYLSDLGGNDPTAHHSDPNKVIGVVRNFLHRTPGGQLLPGPAKLIQHFVNFNAALPAIAQEIGFEPDEMAPFGNFRTFAWCVTEYWKSPAATDE